MKIETSSFSRELLWLVCMLKIYHDAGISHLEKWFSDDQLEPDMYYEIIMEAIGCAAPIVINNERLYDKHGYSDCDGEVNIWAYSSKEMQKYYKLARKLHRLEGNKEKDNKYIAEIGRKIEGLRGFYSYNIDYIIGNKRKGAQLEVLWWYEFCEEIPLCMWVVRVMSLFKEELPKLQEKYRQARRKKRLQKSMGTGGVACAA